MIEVDFEKIDFSQLTKDDLEIIKMILDVNKIQVSIQESQASIEKMKQDVALSQASVEKMRAETDKAIKETRHYPIIPIVVAIITSSAFSGLAVAMIAHFLLK